MAHNEQKNSLFQVLETCPSCGGKYNGARASIIKSDGNSLIVHITCAECQTSILSNVSYGNLGVVAVGMLTDLGEDDLGSFKGRGAVTIDEVIEMHEYIEKKGFISLN